VCTREATYLPGYTQGVYQGGYLPTKVYLRVWYTLYASSLTTRFTVGRYP